MIPPSTQSRPMTPYRSVPASATMARPTLSPMGDKVQFGAGKAPPPGASGEPFTWNRFVADLWGHVKHAENREILKGLAYKYGPDLSLPILFMVPVLGWVAAVVMIPVAWVSKKWGEKILKKANLSKDGSKPNPIRQIAKIEQTWNEKPHHGMADRLMDEFNQFTRSLFPDNDCPRAQSLREMLTMTKDKKGFRLLNHAVNARIQYSDMLVSKICKPLNWISSHMPLKSLGLLFSLPELAIQGSLMLKSHRKELAKLAT